MSTTPKPVRRRSVAAKAEEGTVTATSARKTGGQWEPAHETSQSVPVDDLPEHVARVRISAGVTEALGNFEFLRIDASVELPCAPHLEDIRVAKTRAAELVCEFIEDERQRALGTEGVTSR